MNDKFVNDTGVQTIKTWVEGKFETITNVEAVDDKVDTLSGRVDDIVAEGGEPNKIDSISVNGTTQTITNKNVDITIPTKTSDLTNDGDGTSNFATESYVDTNGGKIDVIKVNGTAQTITNKEVDLTIPTKVSDLNNDSGFITSTVDNLTNYYKKSETYTKTEIDNAIGSISSLDIQVVQTLPTQDISTTTIYLVPRSTSATNNSYDEYIYTNNAWEKIGSTDVDLSNYWNSTNLQAMTVSEINAILNS